MLTVAFLALFWLGVREAFEESQSLSAVPDLEEQTLVGATLVGLSMFVTLFLGTVLAVFLTLSAVRGDAERGLLQPIVVRPIGRTTLLVARFAAASAVCVVYVELVFASAVVITGATGTGGRPTPSSSAWGWARRSSWSSRSRSWARRSSPRPPTASPSSWSSAPGSRQGCWARSARR